MARIKDINGDGKRDFKDTWLGEKLLGGGKTKGPNLKESMAGARRESSAAPMKAAANKAKPTAKAAAPKPITSKVSDRRSGAVEPKSAISGASRSTAGKADKAKTTPVRLGGTPATGSKIIPSSVTDKRMSDAMSKVTESQWKDMTPAERKIRNLPVTGVDGVFNKRSNFKKDKKDLMDIKGADAVTGFRKGGMVSKKGKC